MLRLRGGSALSTFRLEKLTSTIQAEFSQVSHIYAEYWHFCELSRDLQQHEMAILQQLLTYGPARQSMNPTGELMLVLPRPGTISP